MVQFVFRMTSMAKAIDTLLSVQEKNGACLQSLQDRVPVNGLEAGGLDVRLSTEITPKIVGEVNSKLCEFSGMIESLNVDQTKQIHEMSFQMKAIGETQLKKKSLDWPSININILLNRFLCKIVCYNRNHKKS